MKQLTGPDCESCECFSCCKDSPASRRVFEVLIFRFRLGYCKFCIFCVAPREISFENYYYSVSRWLLAIVAPVAKGDVDRFCILAFTCWPGKSGDCGAPQGVPDYCLEISWCMLAFVRLYLISQTWIRATLFFLIVSGVPRFSGWNLSASMAVDCGNWVVSCPDCMGVPSTT